MAHTLQTNRPSFRVSVLEPLALGRARVVESWITDGKGAIEALDAPRTDHFAVQIEMEDWEMGLAPWMTEGWSARQQLLQ